MRSFNILKYSKNKNVTKCIIKIGVDKLGEPPLCIMYIWINCWVWICNFVLVTKDLTGFELPSLPPPKAESQSDNSEDSSKPDLKELFFSLIDYVKEPLESFKQMVFNGKNVNLKKKLII